MTNPNQIQQAEITIGFTPGSPSAYKELGQLVTSFGEVINCCDEDTNATADMLHGVENVGTATRRLTDLSLRLIDFGDHPHPGSPLKNAQEGIIIEAAVRAAASGHVRVERKAVQHMVAGWNNELDASKRTRTLAKVRSRGSLLRLGRTLTRRQAKDEVLSNVA